MELKEAEPASFQEAVRFDRGLRNSTFVARSAGKISAPPIPTPIPPSARDRHRRAIFLEAGGARPSLPRSARVIVAFKAVEPIATEYPLYDYQRQVLHDTLDVVNPPRKLSSAGRRVLAHLPTGAGKTRIACHAAAMLLNQRTAEGKVVVWLTSSEELCDQAAESLMAAWRHVGNRDVAMQRFWGSERGSLDDLHAGFLVAGLPKLWAVRVKAAGCASAALRACRRCD